MKTRDNNLVQAYERIMERAKNFINDTTQEVTPRVHKALDVAAEITTELGELSREEAQRISAYLKRDLHDAADYLVTTGGELKDWLRFDTALVEDRIMDALALLVDNTKVELADLASRAEFMSQWHTGEITGPGLLICDNCAEELHFKKAGHIPPCPKCHGSVFTRRHDTQVASSE